MKRLIKVLAVAGFLAGTASIASAAPVAVAPVDGVGNSNIIKVHGAHRSCERDRRGWHRHNQWGERRSCRQWRGKGKRPQYCVKVGPIYYCDY
ncbi:hypothetical protein ACO2I3_16280 [Leptospira interrogans]